MPARNPAWLLGLALAVVLGAWLRLHALGAQVVLDDEWHAIHKLMTAGYAEIFRSFGWADHSIPLTLLYKAMADTFGLTEINLRVLQVGAGIALIPVAAGMAWAATRSPAVTLLYAYLIAGAPFLVLYARVARPYAITTLLTVLVLAALWVWREKRSVALGAVICGVTALSAWLHPISALFPAAAMLFIFAEDIKDRRSVRAIVLLGGAAAIAIALLLAAPAMNDLKSLSDKSGGNFAGAYTLARMVSLFAGGLPDVITAIVAMIAAVGAWLLVRSRPVLGAYLIVLCVVPIAVLMWVGAAWSHQGYTFARYVFPVQLVFLLWVAIGVAGIVRIVLRGPSPRVEVIVAGAMAAAYLAANPAIRQVSTLGPWYSHLYHHFDYADANNVAVKHFENYAVPRFYRELGKLPRASLAIIEAPFSFEAPNNPFAYFATLHHQREIMGMLHDLCLDGRFEGEVPKDPRFRFRNFVFLDDRDAVLATGARFLLLNRDLPNGKPFVQADRCLAALTKIYGPPVDVDSRVAVFDLSRGARR